MAAGSAGVNAPGLVEINVAQATANIALIPQVVLDDPTNGSVVVHLGGEPGDQVAATSVANGAAIGTGGTPATSLDANASDLCGIVTIKDGTSAWAAGVYATVTFGTPHTLSTYVVLTPADSATAALWATLKPYAPAVALTGFSVAFQVADSGAQHTLNINYQVFGR